MLSADHRRILRQPNNRQAQGHYMTDEQYIHIIILFYFCVTSRPIFKMTGYNVPIYQLTYCQLIILPHVELKYEKHVRVIRCKSVDTYF